MRIRVSYSNDNELENFLAQIGENAQRIKKQPPKGKYKLVYLDYNLPTNTE